MIWLFNTQNKRVGLYNNFEAVCDHFRRLEHLKTPSAEAWRPEERWDFIYWPHKRLSTLHEHFKDTHFSEAEREAYEHELDLIEIFDGRGGGAEQHIVTPELDISELMRDWCFEYAYAHEFTILEILTTQLPQNTADEKYRRLKSVDPVGFQGAQVRIT